MDLIYEGGASVYMTLTLYNDMILPVNVRMHAFRSVLVARIPSLRSDDMIGYSFAKDPGVNFTVDVPVLPGYNEMLRKVINKLLETVVKRSFADLWVLPKWRTAYLPFLDPIVETPVSIKPGEIVAPTVSKKPSTKAFLVSKASQLWETKQTNPPKPSLVDGFANAIFPLNANLPFQNSKQMLDLGNRMADILLSLSQMPSESPIGEQPVSSGSDDDEQSEFIDSDVWKTLKSQLGIHVQRMSSASFEPEGQIVVNRGRIPIKCDANRTFQVLSNSAHFRHVYGSMFSSASELVSSKTAEFSIHHFLFNLKEAKKVTLLSYKRKPNSEPSEKPFSNPGEFLVAIRSTAGFVAVESISSAKEPVSPPNELSSTPTNSALSATAAVDSNESAGIRLRTQSPPTMPNIEPTNSEIPKDPKQEYLANSLIMTENLTEQDRAGYFYLFGYRIIPVDANNCVVIAISHLSSDLEKLYIDFAFCKKLKLFIEELVLLTDSEVAAGIERKVHGKGNLSNLLGSTMSTANSILNSRKVTSAASNLLKTRKTTDSEPVPVNSNDPSVDNLLAPNGVHPRRLSQAPFLDFEVPPKGFFETKVEFQRIFFGEKVSLNIEYICKLESIPTFAIYFVPESSIEVSDICKLMPTNSNRYSVLPEAYYRSNQRNMMGSFPISDFNTGSFFFRWENPGKSPKRVHLRIAIDTERDPFFCLQGIVDIPRKQIVKIPVIYDCGADLSLKVEYGPTPNLTVPLSVGFVPHQGTNKGEPGKPLSIISGKVTPKASMAVSSTTVIPMNHGLGMYFVSWENNQSLVYSKQIGFNISVSNSPS